MPAPKLSILSLPSELILIIADYLPVDAVLAMRFTHSRLYRSLLLLSRLKSKPISDCSSLAIRTYLAKRTQRSHVRCISCKTTFPTNFFNSANSPLCTPIVNVGSHTPTEVLELPPRLCPWHVDRLVRTIKTGPGGRDEWVSHMNRMCMHANCGKVQEWESCDCECDTCFDRPVRTYTRYLSDGKEVQKFRFYRQVAGVGAGGRQQTCLWVRETGTKRSKSYHVWWRGSCVV